MRVKTQLLQCLSSQEAEDLIRYCLEDGEIIPGRHFRDELVQEGLAFEDALTVLRTGRIHDPPEPDIKTGEWKYRVEGHETRWNIRCHRIQFQDSGKGFPHNNLFDRVEEERVMGTKDRSNNVCSNCGAKARVSRGDYRFLESGLKNVLLQDIDVLKCPKCENVDPIIPRANDLMRLLAIAVAGKPYRLTGDEVRFLRKYLRMTGDDFCRLIHVDRATLSKWENNDDQISHVSDRLVRSVTLGLGEGLKEKIEEIMRNFPEIQELRDVQIDMNPDTMSYEYA